MPLSSRLAVSGQICYYSAGYLVLSGRISGIIRPDIRYYPAGYPVRRLAGYPAGYPNPALKNCRISGIRLSGFVSISRISGIRLSGKIAIRYIPSKQLFVYVCVAASGCLTVVSFFWFPCCSNREDLSVDISITYVGLILTKPGQFFFSAYRNSGYGQNTILSNILKNFHISGFPWAWCSTCEDHSIDVSITNVGLILMKLRWFQLFVKSQNLNFELFWKKNQIFGFPWCSTPENLSIDVSITNVRLILMKLWWFQLFVKRRISNFFEKKFKFSGFHGVVLVKTFPLMYQLLM